MPIPAVTFFTALTSRAIAANPFYKLRSYANRPTRFRVFGSKFVLSPFRFCSVLLTQPPSTLFFRKPTTAT